MINVLEEGVHVNMMCPCMRKLLSNVHSDLHETWDIFENTPVALRHTYTHTSLQCKEDYSHVTMRVIKLASVLLLPVDAGFVFISNTVAPVPSLRSQLWASGEGLCSGLGFLWVS